jgi:hypothetical protein
MLRLNSNVKTVGTAVLCGMQRLFKRRSYLLKFAGENGCVFFKEELWRLRSEARLTASKKARALP